jgi:hypothetical protein
MLSMKGGNSDNNRSDLDKGNILKLTFDTLTEEGHKAFEPYRANPKGIFLSRGEVTRHETLQQAQGNTRGTARPIALSQ